MSPTALFTASTFECFDAEPFEWDLLDAPLLEPRDLLAADFAFAFGDFAFDAFGLADLDVDFDFDDFDVDLVLLDDEAVRFFGLAFV